MADVDGALGCWGPVRPGPSGAVLWLGSTVSNRRLHTKQDSAPLERGVGMAPGQAPKLVPGLQVSASPDWSPSLPSANREGGWHQTLTNGTGSLSPSGAKRSDG